MPKTRASVLMWRIKLPFVKVDRIHDSPCKIGVVLGRADKAGGENERDSARIPLACSRRSDSGNGARKNAARLSTASAPGKGLSVASIYTSK